MACCQIRYLRPRVQRFRMLSSEVCGVQWFSASSVFNEDFGKCLDFGRESVDQSIS